MPARRTTKELRRGARVEFDPNPVYPGAVTRKASVMRVCPRFLMRLSAVVFFATAVPNVSSALEFQSSVDDADEIGSKLISYRESLTSGVVEFDSSFRKQGAEPRRTRYTVSFDGNKLRATTIRQYEDGEFEGQSYRECDAFPGDGRALFYGDKKLKNGGVLVGSIRQDSKETRLSAVPDPRLVGILPSDFLMLIHMRVNSLFGNQEWKVARTQPAVIGEHECVHVSYIKGDENLANAPLVAEAWIDAARDWNVLRLILKDSPNAIEDRIDCELAPVPDVGWFPSSVRYERRSEGKVTREEDLRIRVLQFNKDVPQETFTFATMEVPDGHDVYDHTTSPSTHYKVTDGKLVVAGGESISQATDASTPSPVRTWILLANGLVLGALALWFFWRRSERRRPRAADR